MLRKFLLLYPVSKYMFVCVWVGGCVCVCVCVCGWVGRCVCVCVCVSIKLLGVACVVFKVTCTFPVCCAIVCIF